MSVLRLVGSQGSGAIDCFFCIFLDPAGSFKVVALGLVGRTLLAEDAVVRDAVDKRVDGSLKKVYSGAPLALRAGIYGTYVAQSPIADLTSLGRALDESTDCAGLLELIERHLEFSLIFLLM
ncbi:hypothetical protein NDU88_005457 [Pleurodeles waltl]|uniref:Uncharacterized protein n=1 Tax=Pleurodeles waltl TaxID=8319 RepID=A0AAV7M9D2_PLEWA|nr:hypothetical protein NDU88_005457 [Pleurodeles waltl]